MSKAWTGLPKGRTKPPPPSPWITELRRVEQLMRQNEQLFDLTDDFDLTEYAIYQRIALERRYRYLLRQVKGGAPACETPRALQAVNR